MSHSNSISAGLILEFCNAAAPSPQDDTISHAIVLCTLIPWKIKVYLSPNKVASSP